MPIKRSVGEGGENKRADVLFVQLLLADWQSRTGLPLITVDGLVGPKTVAAIKAFQQEQTGVVDGRVDPDGPAIQKLEALHVQGLLKNEAGAFRR